MIAMNSLAATHEPSSAPVPGELELSRLRAAVSGFSTENLIWSSGYLAGLAALPATPAADQEIAAVQSGSPGQLTILYGSQTGNAKRIADDIAVRAAANSIAARVVSMADYRPQDLKRETALLVIVSTHGEGDPPDDAEELHEFVSGSRAPRLESLSYSVLALGDSSYAQFCATGREFDERLAALGATRMVDRVDCDLDFEDPAEKWGGEALDRATEIVVTEAAPRVPSLRAVTTPLYSAERPFAAEIAVNQKITGRDSGKDVRHIEFSIDGSGLRYAPGDSLGVVTANPPKLVEEILGLLSLDGQTELSAGTLAEALSTQFEITIASVGFLERYAKLSGSKKLLELLGDNSRDELLRYLDARQIVDVVREYPSAPAAAAFVACLRKLKPRLYSIASSPLTSPDEVAITVAAVRYDAFGMAHTGSASTHLADRSDIGSELGVYVEENARFRLPRDPAVPIIMIGPGTGVAPFRAFLEHREAEGAGGENWLFFGDRHQRDDYLYQLDWARFRKNGVLNRMSVAFSRDQERKIYVQDKIREEAEEVFAWLARGAHVYVCGDAAAMAADVHQALLDVLHTAGGLDPEQAQAYLKSLKRAGRYQRDIY